MSAEKQPDNGPLTEQVTEQAAGQAVEQANKPAAGQTPVQEAGQEAGQEAEQEEALTPEQEAARISRRKKLLRLLAIFLVLDVCIASVLMGSIRKDQRESKSVRDAQAVKAGVTQEMTEEEREEMLAIALGKAHSCISLRSEPIAQDGVVELYLANREESPCAVAVQLVRIDTNEILLETDLIEPGWYLETAQMDVQLEPGEYQCLARCLFYTMDDNAYLGRTARQLLLTVQ